MSNELYAIRPAKSLKYSNPFTKDCFQSQSAVIFEIVSPIPEYNEDLGAVSITSISATTP